MNVASASSCSSKTHSPAETHCRDFRNAVCCFKECEQKMTAQAQVLDFSFNKDWAKASCFTVFSLSEWILTWRAWYLSFTMCGLSHDNLANPVYQYPIHSFDEERALSSCWSFVCCKPWRKFSFIKFFRINVLFIYLSIQLYYAHYRQMIQIMLQLIFIHKNTHTHNNSLSQISKILTAARQARNNYLAEMMVGVGVCNLNYF